LTRDLKNNLNNYPSDVTIFKEFVQAADDALASEIHFVFDFRPSGDEQVFPEWSRMRSWLGPCLLKPFTTLRVKDVPALDLQRLPYQGTLFRLPFRTEETFDQQHAAAQATIPPGSPVCQQVPQCEAKKKQSI